MSLGSVIAGTLRGLVIAAGTGTAAFGLLVLFHPFNSTGPSLLSISSDNGGADALHARIDAARAALRQTESALDNVNPVVAASATSAVPPPIADDDTRAQYEAQIAAATERRDLALRHAQAIRDALVAEADVSSLAEIRDSVMIGQLLSQQSALDAEIAVQGAKFKSNHPTMRALYAQRNALAIQIKSEAASIATALESEARLDDAQIKLLQSQLTATPAAPLAAKAAASAPPARSGGDVTALKAQAGAQRTELDALTDAYLNMKPATTSVTTTSAAPVTPTGVITPLNLLIAGIAVLAAVAFQITLAVRRGQTQREGDMAEWRGDDDPEILGERVAVSEDDPALRAAS